MFIYNNIYIVKLEMAPRDIVDSHILYYIILLDSANIQICEIYILL